jgi:plasmid stabilization system protein ParE
MARKQVIWSTRANNELKATLEYYNKRNGDSSYSFKLLNEIDDLLLTVSQSELLGRLTSNRKTRVIVLKVYLIFYEIEGDRIVIQSFWDNRQETKSRLKL